jgi:hypothetical protein
MDVKEDEGHPSWHCLIFRNISMDQEITNALVPTQTFIPALSAINSAGRYSIDHFRREYTREVVYTLYDADESDPIYGPDGRVVFNSAKAEFVDTYL